MSKDLVFNHQFIQCDCAGKCTGHNVTVHPPAVGNATTLIGQFTFGPAVDVEALRAEVADLRAVIGQVTGQLREALPEDVRQNLFTESMWRKIEGHATGYGLHSRALEIMRKQEDEIKRLTALTAPAATSQDWVPVTDKLPKLRAPVALKGIKDGVETTATGNLYCLYHTGLPCWAVAHTKPFLITHWFPLPASAKAPEMVAVPSFEFEYGLLHLELSEVQHLTNEDIIEDYGAGKGKLLAVRDGEMSARQLDALPDFRDDL